MSFRQTILGAKRPERVRNIDLPRRQSYFPSPSDWRDEVIYFLLPDRFSDGKEAGRPLLDPANPTAHRPAGFMWNQWAHSGGDRFQGGTIAGITSKLDYLQQLGISTLWIGPVFKQRTHWNSYHGYAIQDFLEVDPRFGTRRDLVDLVDSAHGKQMRVLLDVVFNHTGNNWVYEGDQNEPGYRHWPHFYPRGQWRDGDNGRTSTVNTDDEGVWPAELHDEGLYTRAGAGELGKGDINDPHAEFRRTDFIGNRDVNFDGTPALEHLARCYKYWIALTDCDGFRIDTLKHMGQEAGRNFCGAIKEFAANLGKADFFLVGEVAGAESDAGRYREVLGANLNATLDIGESRTTLTRVAKGLQSPAGYFDMLSVWDPDLGSHRNAGRRHVSILDDHDHVAGDKVRFSSDAAPADRQVVAAVAIQAFSLSIPCLYYGTEQALAGPERAEREKYLPDYNVGSPPPDKYLREAMFGPTHPRANGKAGLKASPAGLDTGLPGFGPFGTCGAHCFNPQSAAYVRIAALLAVRKKYPVLRYGRQYARPISNFASPFAAAGAGELITWSRVLDDEEALCVVNGNGTSARGADILVDPALNASAQGQPRFFEIVASTSHATHPTTSPHPVGRRLPVQWRNGTAFIEIRDLPPSEVLVLVNHP